MTTRERLLRLAATVFIAVVCVWGGIWLNGLGPWLGYFFTFVSVVFFVLQLVEFVMLVWKRVSGR